MYIPLELKVRHGSSRLQLTSKVPYFMLRLIQRLGCEITGSSLLAGLKVTLGLCLIIPVKNRSQKSRVCCPPTWPPPPPPSSPDILCVINYTHYFTRTVFVIPYYYFSNFLSPLFKKQFNFVAEVRNESTYLFRDTVFISRLGSYNLKLTVCEVTREESFLSSASLFSCIFRV